MPAADLLGVWIGVWKGNVIIAQNLGLVSKQSNQSETCVLSILIENAGGDAEDFSVMKTYVEQATLNLREKAPNSKVQNLDPFKNAQFLSTTDHSMQFSRGIPS